MKQVNTSFLAFILLVLFGFSEKVQAQVWDSWSITPSIHYGKIVKHTTRFVPNPPPFCYGIYLNFEENTYGRENWNAYHHYPSWGIGFSYFHMDTREVFGNAYSIYPNFTQYLFRDSRNKLYFNLGLGYSYLDSPYDAVNNPNYTVIGSHSNIFALARFGYFFQANDHLLWNFNVGFHHYSNGGTKQPNLGINILSMGVGVKYVPNPVLEFKLFKPTASRDQKIHLNASLEFSRIERVTTGGPSLPVWIQGVELSRFLSNAYAIHLTVSHEYHQSVRDFSNHVQTFGNNNNALENRNAHRFLVYAGTEIYAKNVSLVLNIGTYLSNNFLQAYFLANKWGLRYYIPPFGNSKIKLHVGAYVKTHIATAEYVSFGLGVKW